MWVPELGRNFSRVDLLYLNDYGAYPEAPTASAPPRAGPRAQHECSQFAFWGRSSAGGGLIAGRNMDGENDFRKVTVEYFVAHAVTDSVTGAQLVHFMWPGFVVAASGVSSKGLYVMMNDGRSNPEGRAARKISPFGWVVRQMLLRAATVEATGPIAAAYKSDRGGTCSAGCNFLIASAASLAGCAGGVGAAGVGVGVGANISTTPAVVFESDRAHNTWRLPGMVEPLTDTSIMVTNHEYLAPAYDAAKPLDNWGREVSASTTTICSTLP